MEAVLPPHASSALRQLRDDIRGALRLGQPLFARDDQRRFDDESVGEEDALARQQIGLLSLIKQ